MRLLFVSILISGFYSNWIYAAVQRVEVYTYNTLPPFAYTDENGKLTGLYVELVETVIRQMPRYEVVFKVVPWQRAKMMAEKGEAFAILAPYFHAHDWLSEKTDKPYIWPYSMSLYTQHDIVVCNEETAVQARPNFPEDYEGLNFVMWRGDGRAGTKFDQMEKESGISVSRVNDVKTAIEILRLGRADCTVTSKIPYDWLSRELAKEVQGSKRSQGNMVRLVKMDVISTNDAYLGYTSINDENYPFKDDFVMQFDIELYRLKRNGMVNRITQKYMNEYLERATPESLGAIWSSYSRY
ncbi:ABC transporter substrate-binding protein [Alteromonas ponticola]|uniref:ABC transporter substrate-binding protein n=1 Tax=Alteromonas aquimaris TaxID=2998417 RepID=A0ABT3P537_9ALTE|nr:ABC transporter substrate-binding protein [Alteromonas aquimaris]MCW8107221.1 ABC transporter substrate-binding protein [Alteromonas aquimaris]